MEKVAAGIHIQCSKKFEFNVKKCKTVLKSIFVSGNMESSIIGGDKN